MSEKAGYSPRNMRKIENGNEKADIDEYSKLKKKRQTLKKKSKTDNISPLEVMYEKNQEIKTQEIIENYIPEASLKTETKSENELNEKNKAKAYQNKKVKNRQLSSFKSLKQYKIENEVINIEESDTDDIQITKELKVPGSQRKKGHCSDRQKLAKAKKPKKETMFKMSEGIRMEEGKECNKKEYKSTPKIKKTKNMNSGDIFHNTNEISLENEENGKGVDINGITFTKEFNYEPRIIEDNLIRRKRKAKKIPESAIPDTTKDKLTNQTGECKNQKLIENTNTTLAISKNSEKILSKKKNNSNTLKMEKENTKKKDGTNSGSTALNQLIIRLGYEKVVVSPTKSNLEESNKLDACLIGLKDPLSIADEKNGAFNGEIPESNETVVKSFDEGEDILGIKYYSEMPQDDSQIYNTELFADPDTEEALELIKKDVMKNKKKNIGPFYNKTKEGEIYKYHIYQLNPEGNIDFKCYDEKCNSRGIFDANLGKFSMTEIHNIKYGDHDYIVSLEKDDRDIEIKNLKESRFNDAQILIYRGERVVIKNLNLLSEFSFY